MRINVHHGPRRDANGDIQQPKQWIVEFENAETHSIVAGYSFDDENTARIFANGAGQMATEIIANFGNAV